MTYTVDAIARATGLTVLGDGSLAVRRPAEPGTAREDDLALAMSPAYAAALRRSRARAAVVWQGADWQELGLAAALVAPQARVALAGITAHFQHPPDVEPGIHPAAVVEPGAEVGPDARIGPFARIGARARIGPGAVIASHVSIGSDAAIGAGALLHAGVRIGARCVIGDRFVAQPNAVIGADGFSFEPPRRSALASVRAGGGIDGPPDPADPADNGALWLRIHSLAAVEIGDEVEVGAGTTIDRGTIAPTRIGSGTKIDNQVQIGHNVQVGRTCLLCGQAGIAGSTVLGDRVILGGKAGVADHLKIGSDVVVAAGSLVAGNVPDRSVLMGVPAVPRTEALRQLTALRRLPRLAEQMSEIRRRLGL